MLLFLPLVVAHFWDDIQSGFSFRSESMKPPITVAKLTDRTSATSWGFGQDVISTAQLLV